MGGTAYWLAVVVVMAIGLNLCIASGHLALWLSEPASLAGRRVRAAMACRALGVACGIAGISFVTWPLTSIGVALLALSVLWLELDVLPLPSVIEAPPLTLALVAIIAVTVAQAAR